LSSKSAKHELLNYSELPPVLVHAILSIEDRRFFDHSGVDVAGVARALLHNARNSGDERLNQGGSTITQQLVKNTYLTPEKTFQRKYAEAMLAIALERRLSKEDIFALYCNEVYLGQRGAVSVRGVKEAADIYFGTELKNLSLAQAATIAATTTTSRTITPQPSNPTFFIPVLRPAMVAPAPPARGPPPGALALLGGYTRTGRTS
jgi:penicillin-binding protein 1B